MKVRLNRPIKTILGRALTLDPEGKKAATLRDVAMIALCDCAVPGMPGEERNKRGQLARRLIGKDPVELAAEDIATIKAAIGDYWKPDVVTPAWDMLEGRQ